MKTLSSAQREALFGRGVGNSDDNACWSDRRAVLGARRESRV